MRPRALSTLLALLAIACSGVRHGLSPADPPAAPAPEPQAWDAAETETRAPFELDPDWRTMSLERFEGWVRAALPGEAPVELRKADRGELKRALAAMDVGSLRAAIVLARSREPAAYEALLARLEERVEGPERASDAADVVAAAALGRLRNVRELGKRLEALVVGKAPHPDLEVRVECAAALLEYKRTRGIGFLLRVLREGTPAADPAARDWTPTPHMAWPKSRAAAALSAFLGVPCAFRPDGSVEHQTAEAARLEELWRERKARLAPPRN